MDKYHIARKDTVNRETSFSIAFGGIAVSKETALGYANDMNRRSYIWGTYFVVPAPYAGEI